MGRIGSNLLAAPPTFAILQPLLSPQVESALKSHGLSTEAHVFVVDCPEALEACRILVEPERVHAIEAPGSVASALKKHRVGAVVTSVRQASGLVSRLSQEGLVAGVIVLDPAGQESDSAALRAQGAMDVVTEATPDGLRTVLRRAFDFRGLLLLELEHRCESKRLANQEQRLLGEPPEGLSDDLDVMQPPPLPVGPMSVHDMESASEAFETAYIERVQQLSHSAREAAQVLGVSPATLSRRQKREAM